MATVFALEHLFDSVSARMLANGITAPHEFGWRPVHENIITPGRLVWTPGDPSGALGDITNPKSAGTEPRPIATLLELFTVTISANDASDAESERAQYRAVRALFDAWYAAMKAIAKANFTIEDSRWLTAKETRSHGAALQVVATVAAKIVDDIARTTAPTGTRAVIELAVLDHEQTLETAPAPATARVAATFPLVLSGSGYAIDGVVLEDGDRVLVTEQAVASANGLYVVAAGAWARASDADTSAEVMSGFFVRVLEGDTHEDRGFVLTTPDPIVLDTTPLTFERTQPEAA
jgi:hypothetical protein